MEKKTIYNIEKVIIAYNCITNMNKYTIATLPIAVILDKLNIKREVVGNTKEQYISKKVLTNASSALCLSSLLSNIGVPTTISIPIINIILEILHSDIKAEEKAMISANVAFKDRKMSEIKKVLKEMRMEKIVASTIIVLLLSILSFKASYSLTLVNILTEIINMLRSEYKLKIKNYNFF
jgi:hypothetical protein